MNVLYLYIAKKFWSPFFGGLGVFALLIFLGDMFEKTKYISKTNPDLWTVVKYFLYSVPFWTFMIIPVAVLLAGLFALSDLLKNGEMTGAMALGYRPAQLIYPVFMCALIVSACNFALQEFVSPYLSRKAAYVWEVEVLKKQEAEKRIRLNATVRLGDGSMLSMQSFNPKEGIIENVTFENYSDGHALYQINAKAARWDVYAGRWVFEDGAVRTFNEYGDIKETLFKNKLSEFSISPKDLIIEKVWPEELSIRDILSRIKALKKTSSPIYRELTYLHVKIASPLVILIMCALGFPFAVSLGRGSRIIHFVIAGVISFFFWWLISVMQSAGEAGFVKPAVAGWAPIILFGAAAFINIKRLKL